MQAIKEKKSRRKPKAFIKRYGRVIIGGVIIGFMVLVAIFAPLIATHDPYEINLTLANSVPGSDHIFGTDSFGRDLFSRVVYGARVTLLISIAVQILVVAISAVCGLLAGYFKTADMIIMRIMEALNALPQILLALVIASVLGEGIGNLMISLVVCALPTPTKMVRTLVLSLRQREFVESEKAMGAGNMRTMFLHILPHCSSYLLIRFSSGLASTVLTLASLAYLGVGLNPTIPNWGGIISDGQALLILFPHLVLSPGLAICITVFGFCMLGDGLRDILDPKYK